MTTDASGWYGEEPGGPRPPGLRRRTVLAGLGLLALPTAVLHPLLHGGTPDARGAEPALVEARAVQPDAVFGVDTDAPLVALTFDHGPDPAYTPAVLDALAAAGSSATFFAIGVNARAHPGLVRRVLTDGHQLANHTRSHQTLDRLAERDVVAEVVGGDRMLRAAGSPPTRWLRPPAGRTSAVVAEVAERGGTRTAFWTHDLEDYLCGASARKAVARLVRDLRPGSVLAMHDGGTVAGREQAGQDRRRTVEALPLLLDALRAAGLTGTDLDSVVASGHQG
jgi:peptidoglycan/xylan/chitin deacetylase (PgdA/CDA1 family)